MPANGNTSRRKYREDVNGCLTKDNVKEQFQDYCSASSIHGVQYVGDFTRPLYERWWWMVVFVLSFLFNSYLIYNVWAKWQDNPVIVSFKEVTTPVWEVPFPAVTVCLQVNARRHEFNFNASLEQDSPEELEKRSVMSLLCDEDISENGSLHLDESSINFLISVAPSIEETLFICEIRNKLPDCEDIFRPVLTEDGLCFTFNALNHSDMFRDNWSVHPYPTDFPDAKEWSLDEGYSRDAPLDAYPRRGFDSGTKSGIFLTLTGNLSNQDSYCRGPVPGYKILLHNPAEAPIASEKYLRLPVEQEMLILVTPSIITTTPKLRSYDPSIRKCYYPDERHLRYFMVYTERNCELECLTNYTLKQCGCAAVYMPRDDNTLVCGGGMKDCVLETAYNLRIEELKKSNAGEVEDFCNCLPGCTSISYKAETSQAPFHWRKTFDAYGLDTNDSDLLSFDTMSGVRIFFTDTQFTTIHRGELFGIVDFLAHCGGILGLFSGISFLSFLEIFYFLTIRFWGKTQRNKRNQEIVAEEDENMLAT